MTVSTPLTGWRSRILVAMALAALVFGIATIASGASVLFGSAQARQAAGHVVPFVLWFNFLSGLAYVAAAVGLWRGQRWGLWLAGALALSLAGVFALFLLHVAAGGLYETRTPYALVLRLSVWCLITLGAYRLIGKRAT
jgi:hypothetical protein